MTDQTERDSLITIILAEMMLRDRSTNRLADAILAAGFTRPRAPASPHWKDASTAPKTGEHILVSNVGRGGFGTCGGKRQDMAAVVHWWDVVGEEGFYLSSGYPHNEADESPIIFTHWQPLESGRAPASPEGTEKVLTRKLVTALIEANLIQHDAEEDNATAAIATVLQSAGPSSPEGNAPVREALTKLADEYRDRGSFMDEHDIMEFRNREYPAGPPRAEASPAPALRDVAEAAMREVEKVRLHCDRQYPHYDLKRAPIGSAAYEAHFYMAAALRATEPLRDALKKSVPEASPSSPQQEGNK